VELSEINSGRKINIYTDQPGVQVYTGNHLSGKFERNQGICLETQHFPDSPNNPDFPSTFLKAHKEYYTKTSYKFGLVNFN
jgi:aldose 1-epimerase